MLFAIFGISHVFTIYILSCFGTHFGFPGKPGSRIEDRVTKNNFMKMQQKWGHRTCIRVSRLLKWDIFTGWVLKVR